MIEIMNWIGQDGQHFLGTIVFMVIASICLCCVISSIRGR